MIGNDREFMISCLTPTRCFSSPRRRPRDPRAALATVPTALVTRTSLRLLPTTVEGRGAATSMFRFAMTPRTPACPLPRFLELVSAPPGSIGSWGDGAAFVMLPSWPMLARDRFAPAGAVIARPVGGAASLHAVRKCVGAYSGAAAVLLRYTCVHVMRPHISHAHTHTHCAGARAPSLDHDICDRDPVDLDLE